jgi:hypothetical protein
VGQLVCVNHGRALLALAEPACGQARQCIFSAAECLSCRDSLAHDAVELPLVLPAGCAAVSNAVSGAVVRQGQFGHRGEPFPPPAFQQGTPPWQGHGRAGFHSTLGNRD